MLKYFKIAKLDFLIALYMLCILTSNLMGAKTFSILTIGGYTLNSSVAIFLFPLIFTINDIITEVFGREKTKSIIRSGLVMIVFLVLFQVLATALEPSGRFSGTESAYDSIFGVSIRFSIASLIAFISSEFLDVYVFATMRQKFGSGKLWLRTNVSNFISQFVDTIVFMVLAFYALDKGIGPNLSFITSLLIPYWLLKCLMSVIETPIAYWGVKWLKNDHENNTGDGKLA